MKVADLAEPVRLGFIGKASGEEGRTAVHYAAAVGMQPLCGHDPMLVALYEYDDDCEWVGANDVCDRCVDVAASLLRWWHPRAKLPEWAERP